MATGNVDQIWRPARCQWIPGEPSPDDTCKCGRPVAEPGSPYCEAHIARAYEGRVDAAKNKPIGFEQAKALGKPGNPTGANQHTADKNEAGKDSNYNHSSEEIGRGASYIEARLARDAQTDGKAADVVSLNLNRRHLDESQRAMVAARLANLPHGVNQHTRTDVDKSTPSQHEAAELLNVSRASVANARAVERTRPAKAEARDDG